MPVADFGNSNWHMFQVTLPAGANRGAFLKAMQDQGIGVGVHYPAMHLFKLYRAMGYGPGMFPHAEAVGASLVTLPLFPAMTEADVERVCEATRKALNP